MRIRGFSRGFILLQGADEKINTAHPAAVIDGSPAFSFIINKPKGITKQIIMLLR